MIRLFCALVLATALPLSAGAEVAVSIGYLKVETARTASLSNLDPTPGDAGLAGARLGLEDNLRFCRKFPDRLRSGLRWT